MNIRWGALFLCAGFVLVVLLRLDVIEPEKWFIDAPPAPEQTISSLEGARQADPPAFQVLTQLNRSQDGFHVSRAGQIVRENDLLGRLIGVVNGSIQLPKTVPIALRSCGQPDAYYDPSAGQIVFCDEFFYLQEQLFSPYYAADPAAFEHAVLGATTFILFHEIGHALIHQLDLPVLGREEDAADQIATYLLTVSGASDQAFRGGEFFKYFADHYMPGPHFPYWDEHGLNEQRFYNISCWLYGYDSGRYAFLVSTGVLPLERAQRCPAEASQNANAMAHLLAAHLKS